MTTGLSFRPLKPISPYVAPALIKGIVPVNADNIIASIHKVVDEVWGISENDLKSNSRQYNIVKARNFCMIMLINKCYMTLNEVGAIYGGKHHSTVIHAKRRYNDMLKGYEPKFKQEWELAEKRLSHLINQQLCQ